MSRLYRLTRRFLPARTRLAWSRALIEDGYARDIATARRTKNHDEALSLEAARRFELDLHHEEEDDYLTKQLLRKARQLRVPIPHARNVDGSFSDQWYEGSQTRGQYLNNMRTPSKRLFYLTALLSLVLQGQAVAQSPTNRPLPPDLFWLSTMEVGLEMANKVKAYAQQNSLKSLPLSVFEHYKNKVVIDGVQVYTMKSDDIVCGAPAGAIAYAATGLALDADIKRLPDFARMLAEIKSAKSEGRQLAEVTTQQQEQLLEGHQGRKLSAAQEKVADVYQANLEDSLIKSMSEKARLSLLNSYAIEIADGFNQMSQYEKCVWAAGVLAHKEAENLDARIKSQKAGAQQASREEALGFGSDGVGPVELGFDPETVRNTMLVAQKLQSKAFELGLMRTGTP